jgi:hypothetical protein
VTPAQRAQHLLERLVDQVLGIEPAAIGRRHPEGPGVVPRVQLGEGGLVAVPNLLQQFEVR